MVPLINCYDALSSRTEIIKQYIYNDPADWLLNNGWVMSRATR